jgi:hypothetical protein
MKRSFALLAATLMSSAVAFGAPSTNDLVGNWKGTLEVGQAKLRLVFKITRTPAGMLTAKLDSLDQGANDIPVQTVVAQGNTVRMEVQSVQGVYAGAFDEAGKKIVGNWQQGSKTLPLTLERSADGSAAAEPEALSPADLAANQLAAQKLAGVWNGTLTAGASSFRLQFKITKTAAGTATGTLRSLDQGAKDIPLSAITCKGGEVHFAAGGIGAFYDGKLSPAGVMLAGQWHQSGQTLPLEFKKAAAAR